MEPQQPEEKTIFCQKCERQINSSNFVIHEAMCRGSRESFLLGGLKKLKSHQSKEQMEPRGKAPEKIPQKKTEISKQVIPPTEKPKVPQHQSPKRETQAESSQKFRCTECGYMMSMSELDSHPTQCLARHKKCQHCGLEFPHYLMTMHSEVCEKAPRRQQQTSQQRQQIRQELGRRSQQFEQQRANVRPIRGTRQGSIPRNIVPVSTQTYVTRQGNHRVIIKRVVDQNGRVYQERYRQPEEQEQDEGRVIIIPFSMGGHGGSMNINDMGDFFSGNSGFEHFIRNLMTSMGVNRQQNPGMTKEEILKIPCIKYDPATVGQKSTSCTICVTDYNKGDKVMKLPCGHLFNPECLIPWLKNSSVCPNCRGKVKPAEQ